MAEIKLYIFDTYGTTTNTPWVDKAPLAVLPGRKEKIAGLHAKGAICTLNQNAGGVAFGISTEAQAVEELAGIARELGIEHFEISFGHPRPKWGYEEYASEWHMGRRKPAPGMAKALMEKLDISPEETMVIGDLDEDKGMAEAAGCQFTWSKDFFADPGQLIAQVFGLYQQVAELLTDQELELVFWQDGAGEIGWHYRVPFVKWDTLNQAPAAIQAAIEEHKKTYAAAVVSNQDFDPFLDGDDLP